MSVFWIGFLISTFSFWVGWFVGRRAGRDTTRDEMMGFYRAIDIANDPEFRARHGGL